MAEKTPEDIALERIIEIETKNEKILNLSELDLKKLPIEIGKLKNLTHLYLAHNMLSSLPEEIAQLTNLVLLDCSFNRFKIYPKQINTLINLMALNLSENSIEKIPDEIALLVNLKSFDINDNSLKDIPDEIGELTNLEYLNIADNRELTTLPSSIGQLVNLNRLILYSCKLNSLPSELIKFTRLQYLDLRNTDISIPPEILEKTNEPQTIFSYFQQIKPKHDENWVNERESFLRTFSLGLKTTGDSEEFRQMVLQRLFYFQIPVPLHESKILVVGQGAVGKTSVVNCLLSKKFDDNETKTEGISINRWGIDSIDNRGSEEDNNDYQYIVNLFFPVRLNIWDFGGQEIMHATHQFFLTKRSLYLLVLDSRLTQEENRVEYWLKIIQSFGGESPVLIVGNKIDQHPLDIDRTGLQKKYPNIVGILETSAATGAGIETLKAAITEQVNNLPHVRDLLPETWFTVKTKLEELGRQSIFITQEKYLDLCAENEVSDETSQRTLIGFLHDLGVVLHFQDDPRLEALGILNPQWVTNGVYKILNSHTLFQNKGVLTMSMLDEILNLPEYPRGKRLFIVDMMKKFELCYDIEPDKTFLVPDLLPKDQPDLTFKGVPAFEYAYPVLPSSVITRFIVRMNQKIDDGVVWRTGVVLKIGENKALVKADIEDRKITIAIDGLEHTRRDALSAIRFQLDEIHASIKGSDAQKRVPIPEALEAEPLDYDYLLQLEQDGFEEHPVKNGNRLVKVNVRKLLSGVVSEAERKQSTGNITNIYVGGNVKGNIIAGDENELNAKG